MVKKKQDSTPATEHPAQPAPADQPPVVAEPIENNADIENDAESNYWAGTLKGKTMPDELPPVDPLVWNGELPRVEVEPAAVSTAPAVHFRRDIWVKDPNLIVVADEAGQGGASHVYEVRLKDKVLARIPFQDGPIGEVGVNGVTNEVLIEIVKDRLAGFQSGAYRCRDNEQAMFQLEFALFCLERRTLSRKARGVEGTHKV